MGVSSRPLHSELALWMAVTAGRGVFAIVPKCMTAKEQVSTPPAQGAGFVDAGSHRSRWQRRRGAAWMRRSIAQAGLARFRQARKAGGLRTNGRCWPPALFLRPQLMQRVKPPHHGGHHCRSWWHAPEARVAWAKPGPVHGGAARSGRQRLRRCQDAVRPRRKSLMKPGNPALSVRICMAR